jgi:hypothetical protein
MRERAKGKRETEEGNRKESKGKDRGRESWSKEERRGG